MDELLEVASLHELWPFLLAVAVLWLVGVGSLVNFLIRPAADSLPWKTAATRFAVASPWTGVDFLWILGLFCAGQALAWGMPETIWWSVLSFQGILLLGIYWRARGKPAPFGRTPSFRWALGQGLGWYLAVLPVIWFTAFAWSLLLVGLDHSLSFQTAIDLFIEGASPSTRPLLVLFAIGVAPLAEELLFRGILLPLLIRRLGAVAGMVATSLLFALLHGNLPSALPIFVLSLALSWAYIRTGSLWVSVLMHALFNAVSLALLAGLIHFGLV
ncbi:MAG: CPBP family intramembrane metalloprotease [Verrucomicrobiota bacterium]|jgi:membrane protease YdiL (CAAX protease family)|nr:CPBP family intramembrane metalloprotease [Verrucomicrobiota bacterium]